MFSLDFTLVDGPRLPKTHFVVSQATVKADKCATSKVSVA